jgi:hypothetical protein
MEKWGSFLKIKLLLSLRVLGSMLLYSLLKNPLTPPPPEDPAQQVPTTSSYENLSD